MKIYNRALLKKNLDLAKLLIPLINDPRTTYDFVIFYNDGIYEKSWESIILKSPQYAYLWAKDILKTRWKEAEPIIASHPQSAFYYARQVLNDRFIEGEEAIAQDVDNAFFYARDILKSRFKKAEEKIIQNKKILKEYLVILKRFKLLKEFLKDYPTLDISNYINERE